MSRVWIPNLGTLPIIVSVSLTHIPDLFNCFYESVSCVYTFFSTCLSICVLCTAYFVCCSIFITTFFISFFFVYKFNRHLCHGAYWFTRSLACMPIFQSRLHLHSSNSCVCACQLVCTLFSFSTFIYNHRHIHVYTFNDYCVMTNYKLNVPIIILLCVPASRGFARCLHTCDLMLKGLYFKIHTCVCFLWLHTYHVHWKENEFWVHFPFPYVRSWTTSLSVSIAFT